MLHYEFDWDNKKEKANIHKHGVTFKKAATIFYDPNQLSLYDEDHSQDEDRWITIGLDRSGILQVVVHTLVPIAEELIRIRIISARKAEPDEQAQYQEHKITEMKEKYDFSKAERGKFYHPQAVFSFPIHLDPDVEAFVTRLAEQKNMEVDELVNEWLRATMKMLEIVQD